VRDVTSEACPVNLRTSFLLGMSHRPIVHPAASNELLSDSTSKHVTRSVPAFHLLQNAAGEEKKKEKQSTNDSKSKMKMLHTNDPFCLRGF